jgi:17beta-estradiol 17-dehydrogenase / very-long-chain 3-oxoacyl-CoA reductase
MSAVSNFLEQVPQPVFLSLAAVGALFLGSKLYSYLQLVLSAFVLSGTSVSSCHFPVYSMRNI